MTGLCPLSGLLKEDILKRMRIPPCLFVKLCLLLDGLNGFPPVHSGQSTLQEQSQSITAQQNNGERL